MGSYLLFIEKGKNIIPSNNSNKMRFFFDSLRKSRVFHNGFTNICGLRTSEACFLKRCNVNLYDGTIEIYQSKDYKWIQALMQCIKLCERIKKWRGSKRPIQVEDAFGVMKEDIKFRRFTINLITGVNLEIKILAIGNNLKKYHNEKHRTSVIIQ